MIDLDNLLAQIGRAGVIAAIMLLLCLGACVHCDRVQPIGPWHCEMGH